MPKAGRQILPGSGLFQDPGSALLVTVFIPNYSQFFGTQLRRALGNNPYCGPLFVPLWLSVR
jgi:hypothetical protein